LQFACEYKICCVLASSIIDIYVFQNISKCYKLIIDASRSRGEKSVTYCQIEILFYFYKSASILLIYLKLIVKQFLITKIKVRQLINNMK